MCALSHSVLHHEVFPEDPHCCTSHLCQAPQIQWGGMSCAQAEPPCAKVLLRACSRAGRQDQPQLQEMRSAWGQI